MKHLFLLLLLLPFLSRAQVTTSVFEGSVTTAKGEGIPGATVLLTHEPTGTRSGTQSDPDGKFLLNNLKPGGPYTVQVTYVGYTAQSRDGLYLSLGKMTRQTFALVASATELGEVAVTAAGATPSRPTKTGRATTSAAKPFRACPR